MPQEKLHLKPVKIPRIERQIVTPKELATILGVAPTTIGVLRSKKLGVPPIAKTGGSRAKPVFYTVAAVEKYILDGMRKWRARMERLNSFKAKGDPVPEYIYEELYAPKSRRKKR